MKGHPGYQGDDVDWVASIIRKVGSPRLKLLFDIYHVQIMHGDLIRRLDENKDIIGHVHTAGNPGRGELDETQEIQYCAVDEEAVGDQVRGLRRPGVHSDARRLAPDCGRRFSCAMCERCQPEARPETLNTIHIDLLCLFIHGIPEDFGDVLRKAAMAERFFGHE